MILLNINFAEFSTNAIEIIILLLVTAIIAYFIGRVGRVAQKIYNLKAEEKEKLEDELRDLLIKHEEKLKQIVLLQQDLDSEKLKNDRFIKENHSLSKKINSLEEELSHCQKLIKKTLPIAMGGEVLYRMKAQSSTIDFDRIGIANVGEKDNLQVIKGIGKYIEEKLNALGIYRYKQIANFTPEDEELVNKAIEFFPGRVKRDDWKGQAKTFI
jgi:nucleotidyltransferase/DNA polymerase involved in DNA repair